MPREQQLQSHCANTTCSRLPPDGLHRHHESESRAGRASRPTARSATARPLLDPGDVRPQQDGDFPLTGAHMAVPALLPREQQLQAHPADPIAISVPPDGLHRADQSEPRHRVPDHCAVCHSTTTWTGPRRNSTTTRPAFPLTGAHVTVACVNCHVNNNYKPPLPNALCYGCHKKDFTGTDQSESRQLRVPASACATCHTHHQWTEREFDHNKTSFPLTGTHVTVPCASATWTTTTRTCRRIATAATRRTTRNDQSEPRSRRILRRPARLATTRPPG